MTSRWNPGKPVTVALDSLTIPVSKAKFLISSKRCWVKVKAADVFSASRSPKSPILNNPVIEMVPTVKSMIAIMISSKLKALIEDIMK